ncbi:MAG: hypothetical protein FWE06_04960 [Oscillospiraceae bacterium]|nr:hypothetical protein [Oscillospiraceae bacterium]
MNTYQHYRNCRDINKMLDVINEMLLPPGIYQACHGRYHAMFVVDVGRWNHAQKSAALAAVLMEYPVQLLPKEKSIIIQAIEDHSNGILIESAVGAALLIADKVDISKERILPFETIGDVHRNHLEIQSVDIRILNKAIIIDCLVSKAFSQNLFLYSYAKSYDILTRASHYLGCTCHFLLNSKDELFA